MLTSLVKMQLIEGSADRDRFLILYAAFLFFVQILCVLFLEKLLNLAQKRP